MMRAAGPGGAEGEGVLLGGGGRRGRCLLIQFPAAVRSSGVQAVRLGVTCTELACAAAARWIAAGQRSWQAACGVGDAMTDMQSRDAAVPGMTTTVAPFLLVYGVSSFFTEIGPNMITFVMPSELYPVAMRATGHGISAGIGKLGTFIGVFLFPVLSTSLGLRGMLLLTAGVSVLGMALTFVLPESARLGLEDMPISTPGAAPQPLRVADRASSP
jgi:Sugar (and other) transporter